MLDSGVSKPPNTVHCRMSQVCVFFLQLFDFVCAFRIRRTASGAYCRRSFELNYLRLLVRHRFEHCDLEGLQFLFFILEFLNLLPPDNC